MFVTVDRIEENTAVVELPDRTVVSIPMCLIPGAKEGSVIKIELDANATEERKNRISKLAEKLWAD